MKIYILGILEALKADLFFTSTEKMQNTLLQQIIMLT